MNQEQIIEIPYYFFTKREDALKIGHKDVFSQTLSILESNENEFLVTHINNEGNSLFQKSNNLQHVIDFITNNVNLTENQLNICFDLKITRFISIESFINNFTKNTLVDFNLVIHPVSFSLVKSFVDFICHGEYKLKDVSDLCAICGYKHILRLFIHLNGMAHSAQDIISYCKLHKKHAGKEFTENPFDMVFADCEGGTENFVILKTVASPTEIDPIELGLIYFPIFNKYEKISKSLASKLALIECCKNYKMQLGYLPHIV